MPKLWIGLVEIKPLPNGQYSDTDMSGAYTNGLVIAESPAEAKRRFATSLAKEDLDVIAVKDLETFVSRCSHHNPPKDIRELAKLANQTGEAQFGDFFFWDEEDSADDS